MEETNFINLTPNPTDLLYGFVGWLTSRKDKIVLSSKSDSAPVVELLKQYCAANELPELSPMFPSNVVSPDEQAAVKAERDKLKAAFYPSEMPIQTPPIIEFPEE